MTTLPEHVYHTFADYAASSEYREPEPFDTQAFLSQCRTGKLPPAPKCLSEVAHRKAEMWTWVTELQAKVCRYCHPTCVNSYHVLLLDGLSDDHRKAYLKLLEKSQEKKQPQEMSSDQRRKVFSLLGS
jgi:hypothetical protein